MPDLPGSRKNQNETVIPKKISANKISATQKNKVPHLRTPDVFLHSSLEQPAVNSLHLPVNCLLVTF